MVSNNTRQKCTDCVDRISLIFKVNIYYNPGHLTSVTIPNELMCVRDKMYIMSCESCQIKTLNPQALKDGLI